jgi:HlyD family secretion protein
VTEERIAQIAFDTMPEGIVHRRAGRGHAAAAGLKAGLVLPNASLRLHGGETGVWLLRDGTPALRALRSGAAGLDGQRRGPRRPAGRRRVIVHSESRARPPTAASASSTPARGVVGAQ